MLAQGGSSETTKQKPFISRTLSLTKLFTLRTTRTSSLPVTPIAHSNPESMHGGSMINPPSSVVSINLFWTWNIIFCSGFKLIIFTPGSALWATCMEILKESLHLLFSYHDQSMDSCKNHNIATSHIPSECMQHALSFWWWKSFVYIYWLVITYPYLLLQGCQFNHWL
jgi:hypothetical protein